MFRIVKNRTAWRTVSFTIADDDGGGVSEASIRVKFRLLSDDELAALPGKVTAQIGESETASMAKARALDAIIANWDGPVDDDDPDKAPMPYSLTALAFVINHVPNFVDAVRDEFQRARAGEPELRLGNLNALPGAGQAAAGAVLQ